MKYLHTPSSVEPAPSWIREGQLWRHPTSGRTRRVLRLRYMRRRTLVVLWRDEVGQVREGSAIEFARFRDSGAQEVPG